MISHAEANFSELHAVLSALFQTLSISIRQEPIAHPTFIEGRTGALFVGNQEIGFIGEIHPEMLTQWGISVPSVAFELETGLF
jgi:phenylalanyl-tRNA synthetase beta chain